MKYRLQAYYYSIVADALWDRGTTPLIPAIVYAKDIPYTTKEEQEERLAKALKEWEARPITDRAYPPTIREFWKTVIDNLNEV